MCKAFSAIVLKTGKVVWEFAKDSHEDLVKKAKVKDDTADKDELKFARVEISPKNGDYLNPDEWVFKLDQDIKPTWFTPEDEKNCWKAFKKWKAKLDKILFKQPIIHPFKIEPPKKITKEHIRLMKQWDSVRNSVRDSVWDSVGDSVGDSVEGSVRNSVRNSVWDSVGGSVRNSVGDSVGDSVRNSVWDSVWNSVWDSVRAYVGSFFKLPRKSWKYTSKIKTKGYPFEPAVKLWKLGLVASFDGDIWRLHGGPKAKIMFKISKAELGKWKG